MGGPGQGQAPRHRSLRTDRAGHGQTERSVITMGGCWRAVPYPRLPDARMRMSGVLSVLGAICGTLVTETLGSSPSWHLLGAVLGAALPPTITVAGPRRGLRAASGVAVTAAAVVLTYSGFTLFA